MSVIRPFESGDALAVAQLYELVVRSGNSTPPAGLASYFQRTLLDQPWVDQEIPSLVLVDASGEIVGFQGSHPRHAEFDGHPIRIGCAGQLVTHPKARAGGAGARLVQAYLHGPQELTITDGATVLMRQIWTMLGGRMAHLACISWTRIFSPAQFAIDVVKPAGRPPRRALRNGLARIDDAAQRGYAGLVPPAVDVHAEPLTPPSMLEHLSLITGPLRLRVDYDRAFLEWLFGELSAVRVRGRLVGRLIRERRRHRILGWYLYYLKLDGSAQVLQVAAVGRDTGPVLDDLLRHAWSEGAVAVRGRVEPNLLEALGERRCILRFTGEALVHSADQAILSAIGSGESLLTRLDGEWWMGHHVLGFAGS
jgi:hypothetical protein